ncbi:hypothetical protein DYB32_001575 [Aphanomyces invadans]|uniref:Asparagine synthetase domain-containing protein n=1 Tax=Aphanomyces invadans TaxID=157072 RepID=A0A3R6YEG5_9STRA|nr:hypothetical protein DYB32_001575 [Aphanomyces invadans]
MNVGMYNAVAPPAYEIDATPSSLLVVVGNTKHLWPAFVNSLDINNMPDHPLNEYAVVEVSRAVERVQASTSIQANKVFWVHDTEVGKMIAAVRMVEAHLSVHPTYGPWFGLRAAIVFHCDGPTEPVYHEPRILTLPPEVSKRTQDLFDQAKALKTVSAEAKSIWFQLRVGISPNHPYMYCDAQVRFHYANSPHTRAAIIAAVQSNTPIDYVLEPPTADAVRCRRLFQTVLSDIMATEPRPDAVLLSGGLDTSIIAEASGCGLDVVKVGAIPILSIQGGITVRADPIAQDATFASAICKRLGVTHHCLDVTVEELLVHIPIVSRILETFDPMELRNAIVIYHSLLKAKEVGYDCVVTGDGADELFAGTSYGISIFWLGCTRSPVVGYSFYAAMTPERLQLYRQHIARIMRFSSQPLAAALGLTVRSPFLDPRVVEFALSLEKGTLVGDKTPVPNGKTYGKRVLRQAFPEAYSQWRDKEPIEQGAGTSQLRLGYFSDANVPDFATRQRQVYRDHNVVLRDHEHLVYFDHFLTEFGGSLDAVPKMRDGDDPCPACRFDLSSKDQDFCVTCGFWPARTTDANAASAKPAMKKLAALIQTLRE